MKKEIRGLGAIVLSLMVATSAISTLAQQPQPEPNRVLIERERAVQDGAQHPAPHPETFERQIMIERSPHPAGDFIFLATEMSFGGKLVKGAPYSAQAVTENTHTLSDGNRIMNKATSSVYRDSEGRTRREQTLKAIGPFASGGEPSQTIFISDPVAGTSYTLDPKAQVARKMPPLRFNVKPPKPSAAYVKPGDAKEPQIHYRVRTDQVDLEAEEHGEKVEIAIESDVLADKHAIEKGVAMGWLDKRNPARTESLGKQAINGVEAEGTRSTVTIPAGEIGNERPIEIVSERWYSPELQVIVMTRHSDPRFGDNTYQLTNISRTEPERSLFEVPAGYTVKQGPMPPPPPPMPYRVRKPGKSQE